MECFFFPLPEVWRLPWTTFVLDEGEPRRFESTDENAFTFGQILVLFMVVPLIGDFTAALMGVKLHNVCQYDK